MVGTSTSGQVSDSWSLQSEQVSDGWSLQPELVSDGNLRKSRKSSSRRKRFCISNS